MLLSIVPGPASLLAGLPHEGPLFAGPPGGAGGPASGLHLSQGQASGPRGRRPADERHGATQTAGARAGPGEPVLQPGEQHEAGASGAAKAPERATVASPARVHVPPQGLAAGRLGQNRAAARGGAVTTKRPVFRVRCSGRGGLSQVRSLLYSL